MKNTNTNFLVYLLFNDYDNTTYLGYTNNFKQRLRKHNCEIKGGARATSRIKNLGKWYCYLQIQGLTKSEALSAERTIKNKRRKGKGKTPLLRRVDIIKKLGYKYKQFNYLIHKYIY